LVGSWWSIDDDAVTLRVRVTPRGRRSEVLGVSGDRLRLRVAAPAVEGRANDELVRFVAELFAVRRSAVAIVAGHLSQLKTLVISGVRAVPDTLR
jgi:uncharacterized protein